MDYILEKVKKKLEQLETREYNSETFVCWNCKDSFTEDECSILIKNNWEVTTVCPYCNSEDFE